MWLGKTRAKNERIAKLLILQRALCHNNLHLYTMEISFTSCEAIGRRYAAHDNYFI